MIVRVAVSFPPMLRLTELGVNVVTKPQAQPFAVALRFTWPLKLPTLVTVIVVFTEDPAGMVRVFGLAEMVNPSTNTVTVMGLLVVELLCPTMVTMYVPELVDSAVTVSLALAAVH